ncbi:MAG: repeat-containing protein [Chthoniobacteraceae bacterium]|nr:repeat-containing protein [Chthoniobacteraceae bacterium]
MDENSQPYWAFISYSSKDKAIAIRLHRTLETYSIPRSLVGRPGRDEPVPKRLFPIFRDRDELPLSSNLGNAIEAALRRSRYLIVLCTPDAAKSKWVNEEIRYFKSLGREDRILAVIVRGEPNSSDHAETATLECFPLALRYRVGSNGQLTSQRTEPVGGDLRRGGDGWRSVFLKAVAGITGLGYDAFAKRQAKRDFRRRVAWAFASMLILLAGLFYWDFTRLKVADFALIGEKWGVPEGVTQIGPAVRAGKEVFYRFESRGLKVRRVLRINSSGSPMDDAQTQASRTDVVYREDGSLERLLLLDHNGRLVMQKTFSKPESADESGHKACTVNFRAQSEFAQALGINAGSLSAGTSDGNQPGKSDITAHRLIFNRDGRIELIAFRNSYGSPMADPMGVFGRRFEYDQRGLIIRITNLDNKGEPLPDRKGVSAIQQDRNAEGYCNRKTYLDSESRIILGPDEVAIFDYEFDQCGNQLVLCCYGVDSKPTLHRDGYTTFASTYDSRGFETSGFFSGLDGLPVLNRKGVARYRLEHDEWGHLLKQSYFGLDGKPTVTSDGFAAGVMAVDPKGNILECSFLGPDGKPTEGIVGGYAKINNRYDDRGNCVDRAVFGATGAPTLDKGGVHRVKQTFDEKNNLIGEASFGIDGQPILSSDGFARVETDFDERGNVEKGRYFGTDGTPALHKNGYARFVNLYDDYANLTGVAYFGLQGEPVAQREGYARFTRKYDERGNVAEVAYFDAQGLPTLAKDGSARSVHRYDEQGRLIRAAFFGTDGLPILQTNGYATTVQKRDAQGNITEARFFGINGRLIANTDNVAIAKMTYDARGNLLSIRSFGPDGAPALHTSLKFSRGEFTYDARSNKTGMAFFGVSGAAMMGGDDEVARQTRTYDARNNMVELRFFGVNGAPAKNNDGIEVKLIGYDEHNNRISQRFLDSHDQPTGGRSGVARVSTLYDAMSRRIEESYFGVDGQLTLDGDGVARLSARYDARGNMVEQSYYGTDGNPIRSRQGVARSAQTYDSQGNVISIRFFDTDALPALGPEGYARMDVSYNQRGQTMEAAMYGTDGLLCLGPKGYARIAAQYDRNGHPTEEAYFGVDGNPICPHDKVSGFARGTMAYDLKGNITERAYWDERGEPVLSSEHLAKAVYRYDDHGTMLEMTNLGVDGLPIESEQGFARMLNTLNEEGRVIERSYFGADGFLRDTLLGARQIMRYDSAGRLIEEAFYNANGKLMARGEAQAARGTYIYNGFGEPIEVRRFGPDAMPLVSEKLAYLETMRYNDLGMIEEGVSYFLSPEVAASPAGIKAASRAVQSYDAAGNSTGGIIFHPILSQSNGQPAVLEVQSYDGLGYRTGTRYLDDSGNLAKGPAGYASEVISNDANGRPRVLECFDEAGHLGGGPMGMARMETLYNDNGLPVEAKTFGADGAPMRSEQVPFRVSNTYRDGKPFEKTSYYILPATSKRRNGESLPVRTIERFDGSGKPGEIIVYREIGGRMDTGNPLFSVTQTDDKQRVVECSYIDASDHLITRPEGYARFTQGFDAYGFVNEQHFFDTQGKPVMTAAGCAAILTKRDEKGRVLEVSNLGIDGRPIVTRNTGFATMKMTYRDEDHAGEQRYFDQDGEPTRSVMGIYCRKVINDADGRTMDERFFDLDGKPMRSYQGLSGIHRRFETGPKPVEETGLDEKGKLCRNQFGYAKARYVRDARGNPLREEYWDENDQPAFILPSGHWAVLTSFDESDRPLVRELVFGTPSSPTGAGGVAKARQRLDERGNAVEVRYLDVSDQPVLKDGSAGTLNEFDMRGRVISESHFDSGQKPVNNAKGFHRFTQRFEGLVATERAYFGKDGHSVAGPSGWSKMICTPQANGAPSLWKAFDAQGEPAEVEVFVDKVIPGGQGQKLGLMAGDVITSYEDVLICDVVQLIELVDTGNSLQRTLLLERAGARIELQAARGKLGIILNSRLRKKP